MTGRLVLRIDAAAPLPVLGPGGPALRVGLPSDDLGVLKAPADVTGWDGPGACGRWQFPSSLSVIRGFVSAYLEFPVTVNIRR